LGDKSICVIGGGLAGGIAASTLAAKGHSVTLVELGDDPAPLLPGNEEWESAKVKAAFTRGKGVGGTSNFWHGGLTVLDKTDVEGPSLPGGDSRAPISYARLRELYARAMAVVRNGGSYSLDDIEDPSDASLAGFATPGSAFRLKALLYPQRPFSTRPLIERAAASHGLRVVTNVEIRKLVSASARRVAYAEGVDINSGAPRRFPADIFILSAGGLGSPKILLESIVDLPALEGLPIGRFVTDHPTGFVFKAKLRHRMDLTPFFGLSNRGFKVRYGFALKDEHLANADFHNHILYLRPATSLKDPAVYDFLKRNLVAYRGRRLTLSDVAYLFRNTDLLFDAINFKYGLIRSTRYISGLVFAEQLPSEEMRIHRREDGSFAIRWNVSDADAQSLQKFLKLFSEHYGGQFETFTVFPDVGARLDCAGHHSGACRMASSAANGVVDSDLRVFGTDNLFVVDGSVLAYTGHANTGLTIAALALKCCDTVGDS